MHSERHFCKCLRDGYTMLGKRCLLRQPKEGSREEGERAVKKFSKILLSGAWTPPLLGAM